jgi:hypothetical protein
VKNPDIEEGNEAIYQQSINEVAIKVHEFEMYYRKLAVKLPIKLDDIFEAQY